MKTLSRLFGACALLFATSVSSAQSVSSDIGVVKTINGPIEDHVLAKNMGPVKLTAWWGATSEILYFGEQGGNFGFFGTGLDLTVDGNTDTYFATWSLNNKSSGLSRLTFEADQSATLFDRNWGFFGLEEGTPGSNIGNDFDMGTFCLNLALVVFCNDTWNASVTYRNAVALSPNDPVGDLFTEVDIIFGTTMGKNKRVDGLIMFDTDLDLSPTSTVPEPSTYALMAAGLAGLAFARRRRRA